MSRGIISGLCNHHALFYQHNAPLCHHSILLCQDNGISWHHQALLYYHNVPYCALQYPAVLWCFIVPSQWILVHQQLCVQYFLVPQQFPTVPSKGPSCYHNALLGQQYFTVASQSSILPSRCPNNVCGFCIVMVITFPSHGLLMTYGFHPRALLCYSNALFCYHPAILCFLIIIIFSITKHSCDIRVS